MPHFKSKRDENQQFSVLKNVILRLFITVLKSSIFTKLIFTKKDKKRVIIVYFKLF